MCRDSNLTLEEIVEQRKNELMADTETLSSTYRKLSSAPDYRSSSKTIGAIGTYVLSVLGALIVLPDLCVVISYLLKTLFSCKEPSWHFVCYKNQPYKMCLQECNEISGVEITQEKQISWLIKTGNVHQCASLNRTFLLIP